MTMVLIATVIVIVAGWVALTFFVKAKQRGGAEEVRAALGEPLAFDDKAVCEGTESGGDGALMGMGTLGVNDTELLFIRWEPRDELRIARADVIESGMTVEHLGKDLSAPMFQIRFKNPEHTEGETPGEDSVAFKVQDADAWIAAFK